MAELYDYQSAERRAAGERWTSRADDVLHHVIIHGGYHRGQIALIVCDSGETPAHTDFIDCTRAGLLSD